MDMAKEIPYEEMNGQNVGSVGKYLDVKGFTSFIERICYPTCQLLPERCIVVCETV